MLLIEATEEENLQNSCDSVLPGVPVRKIGTSRRSSTGYVAFRGEKSIQFESTLERDFIRLQEFYLSVVDVVSQPCTIPFTSAGGRELEYTPDFLVYYGSNTAPADMQQAPLLVEVKPQDEWRMNWRQWLGKWKAARRFAHERGWRFKVMDESRIRGVALANINFLSRYRFLEFPLQESERIVQDVQQSGMAAFEDLLRRHFRGYYQAQGIAHLWHLLATRRLECDIALPLGNQTELWMPDGYR